MGFGSDRVTQLIAQTETARAILVFWKGTGQRKIVVENLSRDTLGDERWNVVAEYSDDKHATEAESATFELLCELADEEIPPFE